MRVTKALAGEENGFFNACMYVVGISIRICNITGKQFDLELGLLYVPQSILQEQEIQHVVIQQYKLDVDSGLRGFWPQYVRESFW